MMTLQGEQGRRHSGLRQPDEGVYTCEEVRALVRPSLRTELPSGDSGHTLCAL